MARLNISLPDELYDLAEKWRPRVNLSAICADALRRELEAAEDHRSLAGVLTLIRTPSDIETDLARRFELRDVAVLAEDVAGSDLRERLGSLAASYVSQRLADGSLLAIAGGRQMWCVVRNVPPRQTSVVLAALGIRNNDPRVLHAHPNTLITLLWLLFSPRAEARLAGNGSLGDLWLEELPAAPTPRYFVIGSCAPFSSHSDFGQLLGSDASGYLTERGVSGDFLYHFFDSDGNLIELPPVLASDSLLPASLLLRLSKREDARVILVAGGVDKIAVVRMVLQAKLCNVLITDRQTARRLIGDREGVQ